MKSFDVEKGQKTNVAIDCIHEYGFTRISNFANDETLNELKSAFDLGLAYNNYPYGYGKLARFDVMPPQLCFVKNFFDNEFFQELIIDFWGGDLKIVQEFSFIHDFRYDPNTIYGNLHFDRKHQLKFMLYLTDVSSEKDGAFSAIPKSHNHGKNLYFESWKSTFNLDSNDYLVIKEHARNCPDSDPRYKTLPFRIMEDNLALNGFSINDIHAVTGSAGTLIIFDTHVLHLGGLVCENHERKTIRLHTFPRLSK